MLSAVDGRRLQAIMFTDLVGYTSLTQRDESLALGLLQKHRNKVRPIFASFGGREVKTIGDAFLVEFDSALQATECAVEAQRALHEAHSTDSSMPLMRIGIHVGDVVHSGGDIYGDAVNIASRIEPLAGPGGVCISEQVYDQVRNKLRYGLVRMPLSDLKNVSVPVEVYMVEMPWERPGMETSVGYDKRRVAVLPFANISPDPADEYFADGMTEELIDRLSQVSGLKVIARTSVMGYKKKEKKVSEIGRELGVGTVVEGSVRKASNKIRVTVQLIDVATEEHLWSSRYDKDIDDIFAVQGDIATKIAEAFPSSLIGPRPSALDEAGTTNVEAYSHFLQGRHQLSENTLESVQAAVAHFEKATALDPGFARAFAYLASAYIERGYKLTKNAEETIELAQPTVQRALALDVNLAEAHAVLAEIAWIEDDHVKDEMEAKKAVELNPSLAKAFGMLAAIKGSNGYPKESLMYFETAYRLDPLDKRIVDSLSSAYFYNGLEKEGEEFCQRNMKFSPLAMTGNLALLDLAKGRLSEAEEKIKTLEGDFPHDARSVLYRGFLEAMKGNRAGAEHAKERIETEFGHSSQAEQEVAYINYFLGDVDAFFESLLRAAEKHVLNPFPIRYSPLLEKARRDPRYPQVLIKSHLDPEQHGSG